MSRWADYGFPLGDIAPVSLLLEGLELALAERYACGENPIELDAIEGIDAKARRIDNLIDGIGPVDPNRAYFFATPDYMRIVNLRGLEMIAAYLGEDLVPNPGTELSPVTYAWCMQRYRMINAVYGVTCYLGAYVKTLYRVCYENGTPYDSTGFTPRIRALNHVTGYYGRSFYVSVPVAVYNKFRTPATVIFPFIPAGASDEPFSSFGTSYEEGRTYIYSGESTGTYNEEVQFPQAARDFETMYGYLQSHQSDDRKAFYGNPVYNEDGGVNYPTEIFYDFRPSLEFYDDISQEG